MVGDGFLCSEARSASLRIGYNVSPTCASVVAYLGRSKTGKGTNRSECARSTDKAINIFAKALRPDDDPGAYVINVSEHTFRQLFAKLVSSIGLDPDKATPYSLRRGGATQHFHDGWSFTAIAGLGRGGSEADCRRIRK